MKRTRELLLALMLVIMSTSMFGQETVAILPFTASEDGHPSEQLGKAAQQFLIGYIQKKQKHFKVRPLPARDVNVALHKAGITQQTMDNFTTKEIADVVKADYILIGSIDKAMQGTASSTTGMAVTTKHNNVVGGSSGTTTKQYHATVYVSIFSKDGDSLYDGNKANVFIDTTPDSWKNSILYLTRHFPFYH
ncbi:MAG: hypothetical protein GXO47_07990 [Chlorobi bacterium]|nr:hypothetical protein [Chlorobiota bacterium]